MRTLFVNLWKSEVQNRQTHSFHLIELSYYSFGEWQDIQDYEPARKILDITLFNFHWSISW